MYMPGKPAPSTIGMSGAPGSHAFDVTALPVATGGVT
jgi:hypothetical protein